MKKKFNWGTGIFLFILLFFVLLFSFVYFTTTQKINLVEDDYYEKELKFQEQIDKKHNAEPYSEQFRFHQVENSLTMVFPEFFKGKDLEGNVHFYRPSDYEKDVYVLLDLDPTGTQYFDLSIMEKGKYWIKLDWTADSISYYHEYSLIIQ